MRPLRKVINIAALQHNWEVLDKQTGSSQMFAVVKADAYGHGVKNIIPALKAAKGFAVACIEEALELRQLGVTKPVLLLEGIFEESEVKLCFENDFIPVIHNQRLLDWLKNQPEYAIKAWLKIDSGMRRLGFSAIDDAQAAIDQAKKIKHVHWQGILSHFACADEEDLTHARGQLSRLTALHLPLGWQRCFANSAAIFHLIEALYDYCRPGILLYGMSPYGVGTAKDLHLEPVMTLKSQIIGIHKLNKGETAGYGQGFKAPADGYLATVAGGYGDGLARNIPNGEMPVLIRGKKYYLVGNIAMDMSLVWLANDEMREGDEVIFWGEGLPAEIVAKAAHTIPYTLTTMLTKRVLSEVVNGEN